MPSLKGISHIELTVSDCDQAALWWQDVMGFTQVHEVRGQSVEVRSLVHASGVVVDVLTHDQPVPGKFDERRVGLDHLAFEVADRDELQRWLAHLDVHGVAHSGIIDTGYGPTVVFRDPDNIQLEFFVHPSKEELARRYGVTSQRRD